MQVKKQKISIILNENKKTGKVVADMTSVGRLFHKRLPATGKAQSPTVTSLVAGTTTALDIYARSFLNFSVSITLSSSLITNPYQDPQQIIFNIITYQLHPVFPHVSLVSTLATTLGKVFTPIFRCHTSSMTWYWSKHSEILRPGR